MLFVSFTSLRVPTLSFFEPSNAQRQFLNTFSRQARDVRKAWGRTSGVWQNDGGGAVEFTFSQRLSLDWLEANEIYMANFVAHTPGRGDFSKAFRGVARLAEKAEVTILTNLAEIRDDQDAANVDAILRWQGFTTLQEGEHSQPALLYTLKPGALR